MSSSVATTNPSPSSWCMRATNRRNSGSSWEERRRYTVVSKERALDTNSGQGRAAIDFVSISPTAILCSKICWMKYDRFSWKGDCTPVIDYWFIPIAVRDERGVRQVHATLPMHEREGILLCEREDRRLLSGMRGASERHLWPQVTMKVFPMCIILAHVQGHILVNYKFATMHTTLILLVHQDSSLVLVAPTHLDLITN